MERTKSKPATLIIGLITALVVIFSQVFSYHNVPENGEEAKTEHHTDGSEGSKNETLIVNSSSLPASAHFQLNHECVFICDILFERKAAETPAPNLPKTLGKFLQVLFRVTIAPNAP